jgi:cyclopropane-fatty-acyl-phospholipid synthase
VSLPFSLEEVARGEIPDRVIRATLRFGVAAELRRRSEGGPEAIARRNRELAAGLRQSPIAICEDAANQQHYALPPAFFALFLGAHMKYSCGLWPEAPDGTDGAACAGGLDRSEQAMLELTLARAGVADGMTVLDLGCGWGSLTLFAAARFPGSRFVGLSNSAPQRAWLEARARERGLDNVRFITANVVDWQPAQMGAFDRVVSVEMFEHLRNYEAVLARIAGWLAPGGRLFVHVFAHRTHAYLFEDTWMAERFFTGGLMPSSDLLPAFQRDVRLVDQWGIDGRHYRATCEAWLARLDGHRLEALALLGQAGAPAAIAFAEWRLFLLSCAEAFGYRDGAEWMVSHYLFARHS